MHVKMINWLRTTDSDETAALYLRIQNFHRAKIAHFVETGGKEGKYQWNLHKILVARIIVPSNRLLYTLDQNGTRKLERVRQELVHYQRKYLSFLDQHKPDQRAIVDAWHLSEYLGPRGTGQLQPPQPHHGRR
jgi:hypothetical protein